MPSPTAPSVFVYASSKRRERRRSISSSLEGARSGSAGSARERSFGMHSRLAAPFSGTSSPSSVLISTTRKYSFHAICTSPAVYAVSANLSATQGSCGARMTAWLRAVRA
ncbi:hypothetical protein RTBOTA2_004985 [Rhodotorula toruloides]|nr:hypothetical protein RTBOTA2_004985 [Rhodotorula toruloides]